MRNAATSSVLFFLLVFFANSAATSPSADRRPLTEALSWVRTPPSRFVQYDYIMTARVHLLVFWAGKDNIGSGYIRRGVSSDDPHQEFFQVLFGSDPVLAPRAINRWGAGTEVALHKNPVGPFASESDVQASAFFGFMKSSHGKSISEMQAELKKEQDHGEHAFTGILSRVEPARAVSLVVPMLSENDYTLHQYESALPHMFSNLASSEAPIRSLPDAGRCTSSSEFLGTVAEMVDAALQNPHTPISRCYVYDAQEDTLTIEQITPIAKLPVELHGPKNSVLLQTSYSDVLQMDFVNTAKANGKKVEFSLIVGTQGSLRGVPIQIRYQPNWWFQVVLNLRPGSGNATGATVASR